MGDTIGYTFDVTNPGDVGLTVTLADPRCDAGTIKGPQEIAGDGDDSLDPDEQWRYTCTHVVTASDPDPLPNTARATGEDPDGGKVEDEDSDAVDICRRTRRRRRIPPPVVAAGSSRCSPPPSSSAPRGNARLTGPSGCVYRPFTAVVRGRQIRRVTFFLDGRRVVVRNGRNGQRRFTARIRPGSLRLRRPPGDRPRAVPYRLEDPVAHAGAELPALRAAGPVTALHRLMRVWLPAIALVATAFAVAPAAANADVRLSTERSVTRWAHANLTAKVRVEPSKRSRSFTRLRWTTEDGPPEVYVVLSKRRVRKHTWLRIRIPGVPTGARAGCRRRRWAGCTRSTRR